MPRPALTATVTHRVRAFLASQGVHVEPWSSLAETYESLYALLRRRRHDPDFWPALGGLIAAVIEAASQAGRLPTRDAELLRSWDIAALIAELRGSLPQEAGAPGWREFARPLSASGLGAFLLMGWVAVGCGGSVQAGDSAVPGDAGADTQQKDASHESGAKDAEPKEAGGKDADAGWAAGCSLTQGSVLFETLADAQLSESAKSSLCTCFSGLNASWEQGLTELFATGTPEQIASELEQMMACCQYETSQLSKEFSAVKDAFLNGTLCSMPKPYRGVTLPEP